MLVMCIYTHLGRDFSDDQVLLRGAKVIELPWLSHETLTCGFREAMAQDLVDWGRFYPGYMPELHAPANPDL